MVQVQTLYEEQEGLLNSHMNAIQVSYDCGVLLYFMWRKLTNSDS